MAGAGRRSESDDGDDGEPMLTTQQAAARLGVKPETLYAYVSRGLLDRVRAPDGKGSRYPAAGVEALAARGGRGAGGRGTGVAAEPIRTGLTLIEGDRLCYRGRDVTDFLAAGSFETVAEWLWSGRHVPAARFTAAATALAAARAAAEVLPARARAVDRLQAGVIAAAVTDPLRFDIQPAGVIATTRTLIATMVAALPRLAEGEDRQDAPIAELLWPRLTRQAPGADGLRALDGALILLADHDVAPSTYAARIAASTRAHPYAVVTAGLAVLDGPMHGGAGALAHRLIADAVAGGDPLGVLAERLRGEGGVPGFGHSLYRTADPRAEALLRLVEPLPDPGGGWTVVRALVDAARERLGTFPNSDFALAALAYQSRMAADATETVVAVARSAGWIAHALEEYQAPVVRHRPRGLYVGERPA
ncbi:citrate synthase [Kitasatospora sp. MAP12-15]|uniref:citrate synthase n=1 Tax=unclassified Kitasatospora TaxID=2633591 RepID=UPI002476992C|nr:citrate synthase [Kitasatospora sp. MAP12-44]MDH6114596.1 citrate synthase [Kitasatospora sp. MAP12-44]